MSFLRSKILIFAPVSSLSAVACKIFFCQNSAKKVRARRAVRSTTRSWMSAHFNDNGNPHRSRSDSLVYRRTGSSRAVQEDFDPESPGQRLRDGDKKGQGPARRCTLARVLLFAALVGGASCVFYWQGFRLRAISPEEARRASAGGAPEGGARDAARRRLAGERAGRKASGRSLAAKQAAAEVAAGVDAGRCVKWANAGECDRNPDFMASHCAATCADMRASNSQPAVAKGAATAAAAAAGAKATPKAAPTPAAAAAAKASSPAKASTAAAANAPSEKSGTEDKRCPGWASRGECESNRPFMLAHCGRACAARATTRRAAGYGEEEEHEEIRELEAARQAALQQAMEEEDDDDDEEDGQSPGDSARAEAARAEAARAEAARAEAARAEAARAEAAAQAIEAEAAKTGRAAAAAGAAEAAEPQKADQKPDRRCAAWARGGECEKNPGFMHHHCADACAELGRGKPQATPAAEKVAEVAEPGQEAASQGSASPEPAANAAKAAPAAVSEESGKEDKRCKGWSDSGECEKNPVYMSNTCAQACAARKKLLAEKQRTMPSSE